MPHFGIICPPITGHINPLAALGRALMGRGHRVTFFHIADAESKIRSEGMDFSAIGGDRLLAGSLERSVETLASLSGVKSLKYAIECERRISELILQGAPDAVRIAAVDALLVDQNEPAGATVAEHLELPFVSVCTSLPLNREPLIPPAFTGWAWQNSNWARLRNKVGYAISDHFIRPIQQTINQYRKRWRLPLLRIPDDSFSRSAQLAQMPQEFDFPREQLPSGFHYLGPWFDRCSSEIHFPFEKLDGRPLIYGSLGTLQSNDSRYFTLIAKACAGLGAQLVLSLGHAGDRNVPSFPGDPLVVNYAPQTELLSRAALTITHAGMNTTQQSLFFGVPMVAIPLAHDQPAIAARLARTGAGLVISPRQLNYARLRAAVGAALPLTSTYRIHAQRLRSAILASGGVERAADIVEGILRS
jgi:zeaxanthin glucosyltransferase